MMAVRLRIPIVPMRISGLYEIYSVHDSWPRRGAVGVWIGQPITFGAHTPYAEVARQLELIVKGKDNAEINRVQ
jgi:1-acyl-sn-glycerol-3-phosphate acyltransferase